MSPDLISLTEAAELIGKNLRTIQRYIKTGVLTRQHRDGKNFISRSELEQKFGKVTKKPEEKPSGEAEASKPQAAAEVPKSPPERRNYEEKWTEEVQKHAQTREELGVWKGRAEAYQAFASRLLGSGEKIDLDSNHPESMRDKKDEPIVNRLPQMPNSLIYYIAFAVLFVILILLFVLIRIYTS